MSIFIVTHPLKGNYGGMLQSYALKIIISNYSGSCFILNYEAEPAFFKNIRIKIARIKNKVLHWVRGNNINDKIEIVQKFKNTSLVHCLSRSISMHSKFVVGSDQVWRKEYVQAWGMNLFFLDFATIEQRAHSISYAASFGSDEWEGILEETEECGRLLREFKAVSVREHSGIKICKEVFGVDAVQMPDPTLLLHTVDYGKIIDSEKTWQPKSRYVAAYVLDETAGKTELLQEGASALNLQLQHLMPHANAKKRRDRFPISVPQWLRLIRDCEYFITDSFHGCVFAIIYNKPFVCLGNEGRGNARFDTLLGTFGLEDRLITDATPEKLLQVLNAPIDWERVNAIHDSERERGINFLKENLSES